MLDKDFVRVMTEIYKDNSVLVIGDSMIDVWVNFAGRSKSPEGDHPKYNSCSYHTEGGGASNIFHVIRDLKNSAYIATNCGVEVKNTISLIKLDELKELVKAMADDKNTLAYDKPMSIKTRFLDKDGIMFRYDRDFSDVFKWMEDERFNFRDLTEFVASSLPKNIMIQDYGKGLVNEHTFIALSDCFNKSYKPYIIYGPHITTPKFKNNSINMIKMNSKEFDRYSSMGFYPESYSFTDWLIITHNDKCLVHSRFGGGWSKAMYFRNEVILDNENDINVVGAGDIISGVLSCIDWQNCFWENMTTDDRFNFMEIVLKFAMGIATLKCDVHGCTLPSVKNLILRYYNEYVDKHCNVFCGLKIPIKHWESDLYWKQFEEFINAESIMGCDHILVNGCFDMLHPDHFNLFDMIKSDKQDNEKVIFAINTNESAEASGKKLRFPLKERILQLQTLGFIDHIVYFSTEEGLEEICKHTCPVMYKGEDYRDKHITGREHCQDVVFVPHLSGYHSSDFRGSNAKK